MSYLEHFRNSPAAFLEAVEAGVVVHGPRTEVLYANPKALKLLRLTAEQILGRTAADPDWYFVDADRRRLAPEDRPVSRVLRDDKAVRDQIVGMVDRDGARTTWANISAYPEHDAAGRIVHVIATFVDVTDQIHAGLLRDAQLAIASRAAALSEEELLQLVLHWCEKLTGSTASFFHFVNDDQETIELVTWSKRTLEQFCQVKGLARHYPIGRAGIWADAFRTQQPVIVNDYAAAEHVRGLPEGHARLERFACLPLLDGGKVRVLLGVGNKPYAYTGEDVQDLKILTDQVWRIVSQKRTEAKAHELAQAVEQTRAAIVITDTEGVIQYVNPAFGEHTGYEWDDVAGQKPSLLKSGENDERLYADLWRSITAGRTWTGRLHNRRKDSSLYWSGIVVSPLRGKGGEIRGYLGVSEDITDQVDLEQQLRHAQKMDVLGQLTGGIAHDFNNYLAIISGNLQLLDERLKESDSGRDLRDLIADALWSAERSAELTSGLLTFSRRQTLNPAATDINAVVGGMFPLLKRTLGSAIAMESDLSGDLPQAMVDRGQLETALVNLVVNGRDAMPDGGRLGIVTDCVRLGPADLPADRRPAPGEYVMLAVTDTGSGMPPAVREHVFEPFFTTKGPGKGSGLGLSLVYGFARQTGGSVDVQTEVGCGTTVTLYLPKAVADAAALRQTPAAAMTHPLGTEVILVVEDDDRARRVAVNILRREGYRVVEAGTAADALHLVDHEPRIDLMFTDVVLSAGMGGRALANVVRTRRPGTRVLLTSGYGQFAADETRRPDGLRLLAKPYHRGELARVIREVLDQPAA